MNKVFNIPLFLLLVVVLFAGKEVPKYKMGECYQASGFYERWEKPDIVRITEVGEHKYLYVRLVRNAMLFFLESATFTDVERNFNNKIECPKLKERPNEIF